MGRLLLYVVVATITLGAFVLATVETPGLARSSAVNEPPRLSKFTARIGPVSEDGRPERKPGGIKGTYRLCDDGPQNSRGRFGLTTITHRWGTRNAESLLVRQRFPSISWDIYFGKRECRDGIFWSSTIPAYIPGVRSYPCYSVAIRVRDPGGTWSNTVTRVVKHC